MSGNVFLSCVIAFFAGTSCALLLLKGPVGLWDRLGALLWAAIAVTFVIQAVRLSRLKTKR
jgi:hypothetical protein